MEFKIKISSLASRNINEAAEYYSKKSKSATKSFHKKLSEAFKTLKTNPYFEKRYGDVRTLPLKKFPVLVFFDVDEENRIINILSVFNTYQNPEQYP